MRKLALTIGLVLAFVASPALAGGLNFDNTVNNTKAGIEGVITAPAAPILGVVNGDDRLDLPCAVVSSRIVGLVTGSITAAFQLMTGATDLALAGSASLVDIPSVSPEPVVNLFD